MQFGQLQFPDNAVAYMTASGKNDSGRCGFYARRVAEEYESFKPWLPAKVDAILDIGCGLAGIDVFLARHYGNVHVHLFDGEGDNSNRVMGYREGTKAWADVRVSEELVRGNVSPDCIVVGHVADPSLTIRADLILSLKSWCHHYPIGVYLELVKRSLKPGGTLIVDIRNKTDGRAVLERNGFKFVGAVEEKTKAIRSVFHR